MSVRNIDRALEAYDEGSQDEARIHLENARYLLAGEVPLVLDKE